jgi:hypothetical protein
VVQGVHTWARTRVERRAGRLADRAGAKERYAPAQLRRSSRARQTGHNNGEARKRRPHNSSVGNRSPFRAALQSSSCSSAKQAKTDGYSPATATTLPTPPKKASTPRRLDRPRAPLAQGNCYGVWVCDSSSSDNMRYSAMCTPIVAILGYDDIRTQATNGQTCILVLPNENWTNGGVFKRE